MLNHCLYLQLFLILFNCYSAIRLLSLKCGIKTQCLRLGSCIGIAKQCRVQSSATWAIATGCRACNVRQRVYDKEKQRKGLQQDKAMGAKILRVCYKVPVSKAINSRLVSVTPRLPRHFEQDCVPKRRQTPPVGT